MFDCVICSESRDDADRRETPCCNQAVCAQCIAESTMAVVRYQGDRYVCSLSCADPVVTNPNDYDGIVPQDTIQAMQAALDVLVPVGNAITVSDGDLRTNAWQFGAYTHSPGCGSAVSIIEGCDTLNCPTCGVQINIAGGDPGLHTYNVQAFFQAVQRFSAQTDASQLERLQNEHSAVWDARFMTELTDGIRAGSLVGWIDSMTDYVWGGFRDFLRHRIAPQVPGQGPDGASLFALIASIGADSADGQLLSAYYHEVEAPAQLDELQTMHARRKVASEIGDPQVEAILRSKFRTNAWWRS
jgi:hypothetical protein